MNKMNNMIFTYDDVLPKTIDSDGNKRVFMKKLLKTKEKYIENIRINNKKKNKKAVDLVWEIMIDIYNNTYIFCSKSKSYAYFFFVVNLRDHDLNNKIDEYFDRTIFINNIEFLEKNNLIVEDNNRDSIYSITEKGERYLAQIIKELEYNAEKERVEFEKSKIIKNLGF